MVIPFGRYGLFMWPMWSWPIWSVAYMVQLRSTAEPWKQWLLVVGECFVFYCEAMTACHVIPSLSFPLLYAAVSDTLQCHLVSHSHTVNTRRTGEDNHVIPASRGSAPSNRIWNNTTLCFPKQQIWLITTLCGGWCRCMMLRNLRVACQKWQRRCQ